MADTRRVRQNSETGVVESLGYDAEKSKADVDSDQAIARQSTTAGADLGGVAARARAAKPAAEETDPSKMSPLMRASYEAKKRRGLTTDDAAASLANR